MTPGVDNDASIRVAAFQRVRELEARFGGAMPWGAIAAGFDFQGENILLANRARGIFRPRQMSRGVLSVKTTVPREGRERRYDDIASEDGFFEYRFMGDDPGHGDNRGLREAFEDQSPLIYFHGVAPSVYQAISPVFVADWDAKALSVKIIPGEVEGGIRAVWQSQGPISMSRISVKPCRSLTDGWVTSMLRRARRSAIHSSPAAITA